MQERRRGRIGRVTIVGGGTAGWVTAALLVTALNRRADGPPVEVTLIESPGIPTIGVGEATVPAMPRLLRQLELDEAEFFLRCNASFKCGVRFVNWQRNGPGGSTPYFHPFNTAPYVHGVNPAYHFHKFTGGERPDLVDGLVPNKSLIDHRRGPRQREAAGFEGAVAYAYHLDAGLFANYLREVATGRGVRHVSDDVEDVVLDANGNVARLNLRRTGPLPVEFVIDCSGFRSLVLGGALDEPFESWSEHLLCDRAIPVQLPHLAAQELEPCTTSTALGAGWVWTVPLYTRVGTGYVYSSAFRTDDEALAEFRAHLADRGYPDAEPNRVIRMYVGKRRRMWVKNCVAIGLSGSFVEPLESTAIYMIEMAARQLLSYFPDCDVSPALARRFNRFMDGLCAEIRDFIVMHYCTSDRNDTPFWVAARSDILVPDALRENLALWRHVLPGAMDTPGGQLFDFWNYLFVLYGKGFFRGTAFSAMDALGEADWRAYQARLAETKSVFLRQLPGHFELVTALRARAAMANPALIDDAWEAAGLPSAVAR